MKNIGKIILALVILAVPIAVVWGIFNLKGQSTISLSEARALVETACKSSVSKDVSELSTASTENEGYYPYNYIRLKDCGGTSYLQVLYSVKFALEDGKNSEDYLFAKGDDETTADVYFAYKLTEKGLIGDFVYRFSNGDGSYSFSRMYCELNWNNDEKTEWKLDVLFSEVSEEFERYDANVTSFEAGRITCIGSEDGLLYFKELYVNPSKSLYYNLTVLDIENVGYQIIDTKTDKIIFKDTSRVGETYKEYKDLNGDLLPFEDVTDEEKIDILSDIQTYFKKSWTPKMMLKNFKESNFITKMKEVITPINNQLWGE